MRIGFFEEYTSDLLVSFSKSGKDHKDNAKLGSTENKGDNKGLLDNSERLVEWANGR